MNKMKTCFFEKINKIDKYPQPDSTRKKQKGLKAIITLERKKEELQRTLQEYKVS